MKLNDRGIIISKKHCGDDAYLINILTENNGLYPAIIRQNSRRISSNVVVGNLVDFFWYSRLNENIGYAKCELIQAYSHRIVGNKSKLLAFNSLTSLIKSLFHAKQKLTLFFDYFHNFLINMEKDLNIREYILLELIMLEESGYKLVLNKCVVTGEKTNLYYVSPKSGHAVSKTIGEPYKDKLLILPKFLIEEYNFNKNISQNEQEQALALTAYFLNRLALSKKMPLERELFANYITNFEEQGR